LRKRDDRHPLCPAHQGLARSTPLALASARAASTHQGGRQQQTELKYGDEKASLIVGKLAAASHRNKLFRGLQALGRLVKLP
jgi:hypothetical protein